MALSLEVSVGFLPFAGPDLSVDTDSQVLKVQSGITLQASEELGLKYDVSDVNPLSVLEALAFGLVPGVHSHNWHFLVSSCIEKRVEVILQLVVPYVIGFFIREVGHTLIFELEWESEGL